MLETVESRLRSALTGDHIRTATDVPTAKATLREIDVDCVVSDYVVPDAEGSEHLGGVKLVKAVAEYDDQLPVVLFTTGSLGAQAGTATLFATMVPGPESARAHSGPTAVRPLTSCTSSSYHRVS